MPQRISLGIAVFALLGAALGCWLRQVPAGNPDPRLWYNIFYYLFARNEPAALLIVASFHVIVAWFLFRRVARRDKETCGHFTFPRWLYPVLAISVFGIATLGTDLVMHNHGLTADENLADFQARIFMRGKLQAQVPAPLWDAVRVVKPTFVEYFPATHSWNATYLPVYAAMRAAFQLVYLQALLNPMLAAVTMLTLYATARNIWPGAKPNAIVAVLLLGTSSQFLLMSMTAYAMPAHLTLNTVWLWLYSRPDRRAIYLAPIVGVLAIGLHQPVPHALFVAPFLVRMLRERRWRTSLIFAAIYGCGCVGWLLWRAHFQTPSAAGANSVLRLWNPRMAIIQPMNLLMVIAWSSLTLPLLAALGFARFNKLPPFLQDCALSCIFTFGFYYFFYLDQAHGWGYRYFHGTLGCFTLVAVAGCRSLAGAIGQARARQFVLAGAVASLLVQLPLRAWQAETFVRPFARATAALHAMPTDMVVFDARYAWYSADLLRNDPFLENRPLIVSTYPLDAKAIAALEKVGSFRIIRPEVLAQLGMFTERRNDYTRDPFLLGRGR